MTGEDIPVGEHRVSLSPEDERCTEGAGREKEYEGHDAYWLGFR